MLKFLYPDQDQWQERVAHLPLVLIRVQEFEHDQLKFLYPDQDQWQERVAHLDNIFAQYADSIDLSHMGFPTNWRDMLEA